MAKIQRYIDDQKIIDYVSTAYGFDQGKSHDVSVEIESQPPVMNSSTSHVVKVTVSYGLKLDEVDKLTEL
ncbi:hypothetical protein [Microbacterium lacticum]|uniref:Uncharacterized protein n=1 Tax=Microbacterium lacticum TaxID=33885 RepID=A0A4Y3UJR3_9MICO|nr:hypothetical protein [Microbacterium lacticum]TQN00432.1 hypothetical protein FHX68_0526 [Microbacterium lacticum]GEB94382.1 hypothetical protein MLA01_06010 [Microbacterium lacticum]GGN17957.1 hypothetical protein GCM10009724_09690 [Microbacterium lacticum]